MQRDKHNKALLPTSGRALLCVWGMQGMSDRFSVIGAMAVLAATALITGCYIKYGADDVASKVGYFLALSAPVAFFLIVGMTVYFSVKSHKALALSLPVGSLAVVFWFLATMSMNH